MTPFGAKVREYRKQRGITLKRMAEDLGVSSAYFSALEHGHRGRPGSGLVQQVCGYFELMWDQAEELKRLADISHPRVTVDTAGLSPKATRLANVLAKKIKNWMKKPSTGSRPRFKAAIAPLAVRHIESRRFAVAESEKSCLSHCLFY